MNMFDRILIGFGVLLAVALLLLIPYSVKKHGEWEIACKEAGGVPYTGYKSYSLCLNPTAIVELK